jgi:nickel transport protein
MKLFSRGGKGWKLALILAVLVAAGSTHSALAHGVNVGYTTTQHTVTVVDIRATFDNGEPMSGAQVTIYAPDNPAAPWQNGTCNTDGRYTFTPDASIPGTWEVQVRKAGHGSYIYVEVGEAGGEAGTAAPLASQVVAGSSSGYTPLQYVVMGGCVVWGLVGTALFFARSPRASSPPATPTGSSADRRSF